MIRKYHNHKLQTTPRHSEKEPLNHHETPGRQIKQSNHLSLPIKMIAILEWIVMPRNANHWSPGQIFLSHPHTSTHDGLLLYHSCYRSLPAAVESHQTFFKNVLPLDESFTFNAGVIVAKRHQELLMNCLAVQIFHVKPLDMLENSFPNYLDSCLKSVRHYAIGVSGLKTVFFSR